MLSKLGIESIIDLYNFINSDLIKEDLFIRVKNGFIEFKQTNLWAPLPSGLNEVMIIPRDFTEGYVKRSDLIELYDSLAFVVNKKGLVPIQFTEGFTVPEVWGFSIWSSYPLDGHPGVKLAQKFVFKVRNKRFFNKSKFNDGI